MRALTVTPFVRGTPPQSSASGVWRTAGRTSRVSQSGAAFVRVADSSIVKQEQSRKDKINDECLDLNLRLDSSGDANALSNECSAI
jgi:hypothetical protein